MARSIKPDGVVFYRGPSILDGQPIVAIATGLRRGSDNSKTGDMVQTYIMREDMPPCDALQTGDDRSVCGDCPLRGIIVNGRNKQRACYVSVFMAPQSVWKAYDKGRYPIVTDLAEIFAKKLVRLGSYGDPAAVPLSVWEELLSQTKGHTGYTHQWARFPEFASIVMASADSKADRLRAKILGFRTFRVTELDTRKEGEKDKNEVACPASDEMGHKTDCKNCRACGGTSAKARTDIVITVHGNAPKLDAFKARKIAA